MGRKVRIGLSRDFFDKEGKFIIPGPGLKLLDEMPAVEYEIFKEHLPEVTPEQIQGFDMVFTLAPKWTQDTIAGNKQLISIHRGGVGFNMVDVPALSDANIIVCITPGAVRRPMAVTILTFLLALSTRLLTKDKLTREGRWTEKTHFHGYGLVGKTLGSIGTGNIGHEMFRLAKPLGMRHIAYDPYIEESALADVDVKLVDMDTLLAESDYVNISCPLNESTHHLVGEKELKKMKKTAFLINTARGPIIDEAALVKALQEGWIRGAGLDVFEKEPTPSDNPLLKMDNTIVAPHALGWTDQLFINMWNEILQQVSLIISGEIPVGPPNRDVWNKPDFQAKLKAFRAALQ